MLMLVVLSQFGTLLCVFFIRLEVSARIAMGLDLVFRLIMMIIYAVCISSLSKRLKSFPEDAMRAEVRSIKMQFLSFFIGYIIEEIFEIYELVTL